MFSSPPIDSKYAVNVGAHWFRWESPDVGYISYTGDVDGASMTLLAEKSRKFTLGSSCVFLIVDMAKAGKISAEARQRSAEGGKDLNLRGIAVIGASTYIRIIAGLVSRAIDLVNRNTENPTRFFDTELEARAWIETRRVGLRHKGPHRAPHM